MCASWSCSCAGCACYGWGHGYHAAVAPAYGAVYVNAAPVAAPTAVADNTASVATVVVNLPTDAKLFVDGERVPMSSSTRSFRTPQLQAGRDYFYTMKVEAVRDGAAVEKSARVIVRAGETARADFGDLSDAVALTREAPAKITVKLPSEAKLFVDDVACNLTSDTRNFETPKLQSGKKYSYTLRAELPRDGRTIKAERKVVMTAGEAITVNFEDMAVVRTASR